MPDGRKATEILSSDIDHSWIKRSFQKPANAQRNKHGLNTRCVPGTRMRNPYENKCKRLTASELVLNTFLYGEL